MASIFDRSGALRRVVARRAHISPDDIRDSRGVWPVKIVMTSGAIGCILRRMHADRPAPPGLNAASTRSVAIHVNDFGLRYAKSPVQQTFALAPAASPDSDGRCSQITKSSRNRSASIGMAM